MGKDSKQTKKEKQKGKDKKKKAQQADNSLQQISEQAEMSIANESPPEETPPTVPEKTTFSDERNPEHIFHDGKKIKLEGLLEEYHSLLMAIYT